MTIQELINQLSELDETQRSQVALASYRKEQTSKTRRIHKLIVVQDREHWLPNGTILIATEPT